MTIREAAAAYIAEGLQVVPVLRKDKRPEHNGWQTKTFTPEDFNDKRHNIGIKLGDGIVDVDLDCPEAILAGQRLLPITRRTGRKSKPGSHHWFKCRMAASHVFKDLDGTMILEMRAQSNQQTVAPPSIHESGEPIIVEHDRAMLEVQEQDALVFGRATAFASLLGRHWPAGSRHIAAGHAAGFLLRLGFDGMWTQQIIATAAEIAGDDEVADRKRAAHDTAAKMANGEPTTGGPKLKECFARGDELAALMYTWVGHKGVETLDRLNNFHFVAQLGTDTVVGTEIPGEPVLIQDFESFRRRYYNQYVEKKKLGEWWLSHPQQRRFRKIVFAPPPLTCHDEDYNTWRGFAVTPDPLPNPEQRCRLFLDHLFRVICDEEERYFLYLLDVLALTAQRPGVPTGVAVVLRGDSGSGKGSFIDNFGSLFGGHYIQVDKQDHVTGRFNQHLSQRVVLFADEAVWGGSKADAGALKRLVTEKTLTIERKFMDAAVEPNCLHLFMSTNEHWVWPASLHERRGFILDVNKKDFATKAYFDALHEAWAAGENAAFLAFLLARKVDRLGPLPMTPALEEQQRKNFDPVLQWWCEVLAAGELHIGKGWPQWVSGHELYESYQASCEDTGMHRRDSENQLLLRVAKYMPIVKKQRRTFPVNIARRGAMPEIKDVHVWGYELPTLAVCRKSFDRVTGLSYQWPEIEPEQGELVDA